MKILVIGGGGREHALVWKMAQNPRVSAIFCAPGNAGIATLAKTIPIPSDQIEDLLHFAENNGVDLTVVGPELSLSLGIVDRFEEAGLRIFGASRAASEIETSKVFSKRLMQKYGVPTPNAEVMRLSDAYQKIETAEMPIVLKAEGLASGKGVVIAQDLREAEEGLDTLRAIGHAADRVILEEYLVGQEVSAFVLTDGKEVRWLTSAQDYKRVFDGDCGPNTGGMGAISPSPCMTLALQKQIMSQIIDPTLSGMALEGRPYRGVLYAGLMITEKGPYVLEFNARWGDPEAQAILPRLKSDWVEIMEATLSGGLSHMNIEWHDQVAVCVVLASRGYPGEYQKDEVIEGLASPHTGSIVFHAGTTREKSAWLTWGGRVLGVVASGGNFSEARRSVYKAIEGISFRSMQYRTDIGAL